MHRRDCWINRARSNNRQQADEDRDHAAEHEHPLASISLRSRIAAAISKMRVISAHRA
jgi:hypothetical protein